MTTERTQSVWGVDAFAAFGDNRIVGGTKPLAVREIARMTMLYGLLYRSLIIPDSQWISSTSLQELYAQPRWLNLITSGTVRITLRSKASSLLEMHQTVSMVDKIEDDRVVQMLTRAVAGRYVPFDFPTLAAGFRSGTTALLFNPEKLHLLRIPNPDEVAAVTQEVYRRNEEGWNNSVVEEVLIKQFLRPQFGDEVANTISTAVRAVYRSGIPLALGSGIAAHADFSDSFYLRVLGGSSIDVPIVGVEEGREPEGANEMLLEHPVASWLLTQGVDTMTPEELVMVRTSEMFQKWIRYFQAFFDGQLQFPRLIEVLNEYLAVAGEMVLRMRAAQELPGQLVKVEATGPNSFRIIPPSNAVEMAGFTPPGTETVETRSTLVIAKQLTMPRLGIVGDGARGGAHTARGSNPGVAGGSSSNPTSILRERVAA
jgi:hypothetical protein